VSARTGLLEPSSGTLFESDFPKLEIGDSGTVFIYQGDPDSPIISALRNSELYIRVRGGRLKVSTTIRDRNGTVVAEIVDNEWQVNPGASFDRNYNDSALEVLDSSGKVVLQVAALPDRVQLQGLWYDREGNGFALGTAPKPMTGALMEVTGPKHPQLELEIERMFLYPSSRHLGEMK
jgi:hypothetical protein